MSNADKTTIKIRAFSDDAKSAAPQNNLTEAQEKALELAKKNAHLEDVKSKLLEHFKTIEQLRESLKQEQAKTVEMEKMTAGLEDKVKEMTDLESKVQNSVELVSKVKVLTEALVHILCIAASGKAC